MTTDTLSPNTHWRPIFWEPVSGTGERLMIGAIVEWDGRIRAHRFIRNDVLDCLYGKSAAGVKTLIDTGLKVLSDIGATGALKQESMPSLYGLQAGPLRHTHASNLSDALRTAALLYSSLTNLDKLDDIEDIDAPTQDEGNRRFATEIRSRVIEKRPELEDCFGRSATLLDGGTQTRFGYLSPRSIMHFGVLSPIRQPAGVRDARARLWELHRTKERAQLPFAGLIFGVPREDDPTLSNRQIETMKANLEEIEREADSYQMRFFPVISAEIGAEIVLSHA
ncbi:hypothetical protein [Burkholderia glumae]|uniref:hypothetical protein n=1 Tax=Burkholderia glumae TaxID=337 RepID=UPI00214FA6ED|nr:hypothetical protein [Burkholderia glumae]